MRKTLGILLCLCTLATSATAQPVDTYLQKLELSRPIWPPVTARFEDVPLVAGTNRFRFEAGAKNADSSGYRIAIDCLVAERRN